MVNVGCAEEVAAAFLQHPMYFPEKFNWTLYMLEHAGRRPRGYQMRQSRFERNIVCERSSTRY